MPIDSIQRVVNNNLCISCGACVVASPPGAIEMRYDAGRGMFFPNILKPKLVDGKGEEFAVCPGKGYPIIGLSQRFEGEGCERDVKLGTWRKSWAAQSTDAGILKRASSGGVMTAIAEYLIDSGKVDGAVVTGMQYGAPGPRPKAYIARNREELFEAQGSKYCPSPTLLALSKAMETKEKCVFLGTPCQVAALRMMQERHSQLREKFPYVIGIFCGGFRDCRETDTLIRRQGLSPSKIRTFRYRGGGQPGGMLMEDESKTRAEIPYSKYGRMTGHLKHRRCCSCVDATAELADFSCGDAWLSRFLDTGSPWSIVMARTDEASAIVESLANDNRLVLEEVSAEEIMQAQRGNLLTKKTRQAARHRLFRFLRFALPEYDGGFPLEQSGLILEIKVLLTRILFGGSENIGLYPTLAKLLRRH